TKVSGIDDKADFNDVKRALLSLGFSKTETEALFSTPERPQLDYAIPDDRAALGRAWPRALTLTAPQDTAIAILRPAACSDTMSDRAFDWTIDLLTQKAGEAVIYTGCCRVAPE
ncbi:MAG: hypothetical protein AAFU55_06790, partial [Pseudomonadota bacterium]